MQDWRKLVEFWQKEISEILEEVPEAYQSPAEISVIKHGLALPHSATTPEAAIDALIDLGLDADEDYVTFLSEVGGINLLSMGADDGILFPASEISALEECSPTMHAALVHGSRFTSMDSYISQPYSVGFTSLLPVELVESSAAISTTVGPKVFIATRLSIGNDYLKIDLHGNSVRYGSFEEFMVAEMNLMIETLRSVQRF